VPVSSTELAHQSVLGACDLDEDMVLDGLPDWLPARKHADAVRPPGQVRAGVRLYSDEDVECGAVDELLARSINVLTARDVRLPG
jgi:hypothetical protein